MKQPEQVIEAMRQCGGFATFGKLNSMIDFSTWETKTPQASVRRIVQQSPAFFRIRPGLWALTECKDAVLTQFQIKDIEPQKEDAFSHAYYQGLFIEIGNMKGLTTCVAAQDKNKRFLDKPLKDIASLEQMYEFTYVDILRSAKNVDVVWFNQRRLPDSFFEVEHTTNIEHSLVKFTELQDYYAQFVIVAPNTREDEYVDIINKQVFSAIKTRVRFVDYDSIASQHTKMYELTHLARVI
jgi:hypothetical protein